MNDSSFFVRYKKVILYFIFGSMASLVDLGVFFLLFNILKLSSVLSTSISISTATIIGFVLNALVNFQVRNAYFLRFISYSMVSGVGLIISAGMLYFLSDIKGLDGNIIKIISLPVVFVVQYFLNSRISFFKKEKNNF